MAIGDLMANGGKKLGSKRDGTMSSSGMASSWGGSWEGNGALGCEVGVADAAPTWEEADRIGEGFLPSLTLRKRARLQGFPNCWEFTDGEDSSAARLETPSRRSCQAPGLRSGLLWSGSPSTMDRC
ncbi:hypothetical protein [Rhizobium tibeticum]|uniref:hypothetical protein n=1 Tax=Rhizobium tibeticum TaxID=501024 RepID=UPI0011608CEC|nr:hypothetical protein [Rhizobium tibeticum]